VIVELRIPSPMVNLYLLANRLFRSTLLVSFFTSAGFIGTLFLVPLFLQEARGVSPLQAGLTTMPEAIGVVVSTQLVARLYPTVGPRRLMASGLAGVTVVVVFMAFLDLDSSLWLVRFAMFMLGFGVAYVFLPNQAASLATITSAQTGRASTLSTVQRQLGGALGVAIVSSVLTIVGTGSGASGSIAGYRAAFVAAAVLALIGAVCALFVPDADAAETMRVRSKVKESTPGRSRRVRSGTLRG